GRTDTAAGCACMAGLQGMAAWALAAAMLPLACCSCGSLGTSNQVAVHLDENPNDLAAAQLVADATCRGRGGHARFLAIVTNDAGSREVEELRPPDALFACDPAPR